MRPHTANLSLYGLVVLLLPVSTGACSRATDEGRAQRAPPAVAVEPTEADERLELEEALPEPPDQGDPEELLRDGTRALRAGNGKAARSAFARACGLNQADACIALAEMLEAGEGGQPQPGRARSLYEQACASGASQACDALGH